MTRIEISNRKMMRAVRGSMRMRARGALVVFSTIKRAYDYPGYLFERHDHLSVRDSAAQSIRTIPGGIRIEIAAPAAQLEEFGNERFSHDGYIYPKKAGGSLALPLKQDEDWSVLHKNGSPRIVFDDVRRKNVLLLPYVHAYDGLHRLENSVRLAFGLKARHSSR